MPSVCAESSPDAFDNRMVLNCAHLFSPLLADATDGGLLFPPTHRNTSKSEVSRLVREPE